MWGSSATDVWAVGTWGAILYWDGAGWTVIDPGTWFTLVHAWGAGANVWAVGAYGTILERGP